MEPKIFALTLPAPRHSAEQRAFDALHRRILTLDLPPGARLSETDIALQLGMSRQPVHVAFQRLAKLGFLVVQPQKATRISRIDAAGVRQARFLRLSVELELIRRAAFGLPDAVARDLAANLADQGRALASGQMARFHDLDDGFHALIARAAQQAFAWDALSDLRAHEDRLRFLALGLGAAETLQDHHRLFTHLAARDPAGAEAVLRTHLGRIEPALAFLHSRHPDWLTGWP